MRVKTRRPSGQGSTDRHQGSQKGQAMIELIFSIIMFSLMLVAITSLSAYLYVQHTMVTAAREGARIASLNEAIGEVATSDDGVDDVTDYVRDFTQATTGVQLNAENITVAPPDPAALVGDRSVTVEIDFDLTNPMPLDQLLAGLTGNSYGLDTIPIHAEATMRYEE